MKELDVDSMFGSMVEKLQKGPSSQRGQYLKTEVGNTYTVRIIPNKEDINKTFYEYTSFGWTSFATGQYTGVVSPITWKERCPIQEAMYRIKASGSDEDKDKAATVTKRTQWITNVYVVNDPVNPDNNGTIKILRFGRQLHKIIMEAMVGEEAEELGARIFKLSDEGCDFRIKVEKQGDYPTYVSSKFSMPKPFKSDYPGGVSGILDNIFDLESVNPVRSYDELKEVLNEHFYCVSNDESSTTTSPVAAASIATATAAAVEQVATKPATETTEKVSSEEDIDDLLASLDNL